MTSNIPNNLKTSIMATGCLNRVSRVGIASVLEIRNELTKLQAAGNFPINCSLENIPFATSNTPADNKQFAKNLGSYEVCYLNKQIVVSLLFILTHQDQQYIGILNYFAPPF